MVIYLLLYPDDPKGNIYNFVEMLLNIVVSLFESGIEASALTHAITLSIVFIEHCVSPPSCALSILSCSCTVSTVVSIAPPSTSGGGGGGQVPPNTTTQTFIPVGGGPIN